MNTNLEVFKEIAEYLIDKEARIQASEVNNAIEEIERLRATQFRWIPLKEREPTAADGDEFGYVFIKYHPEPGIRDRHGSMIHFHVVGNSGLILAWAPIPPLPEATQEEKDEELWESYRQKNFPVTGTTWSPTPRQAYIAGLKAARGQK